MKSAKNLIDRSVLTAECTYEKLDSLVIETEGILNARPTSLMLDNLQDLAALTSAHFLIGGP